MTTVEVKIVLLAISSGFGVGGVVFSAICFNRRVRSKGVAYASQWRFLMYEFMHSISLLVPALFVARYMGEGAIVNEWLTIAIIISASLVSYFYVSAARG